MPDVMSALQRARNSELEVQTQLEHIEMLHRIARRAGKLSTAAQMTEKLAVLERELNTSIDILVDAKREALNYVSALSGEERCVIEGYYILGKNWAKLADDLYMSERRVFMLRKSGLTKLLNKFGGEPPKNNHKTLSANKE